MSLAFDELLGRQYHRIAVDMHHKSRAEEACGQLIKIWDCSPRNIIFCLKDRQVFTASYKGSRGVCDSCNNETNNIVNDKHSISTSTPVSKIELFTSCVYMYTYVVETGSWENACPKPQEGGRKPKRVIVRP